MANSRFSLFLFCVLPFSVDPLSMAELEEFCLTGKPHLLFIYQNNGAPRVSYDEADSFCSGEAGAFSYGEAGSLYIANSAVCRSLALP
jgi:hypothetical protein